MKNCIKLVGIIALMAVMVFTFAACGNSGTGDQTSPGGGVAKSLRITGMDSFNGATGEVYLMTSKVTDEIAGDFFWKMMLGETATPQELAMFPAGGIGIVSGGVLEMSLKKTVQSGVGTVDWTGSGKHGVLIILGYDIYGPKGNRYLNFNSQVTTDTFSNYTKD